MSVNESGKNDSPAGLGDDETSAERPGAALRAAREQAGLPIEHVAEVLHLDVAIITALERNQFESLGAPVYVRGHIRKYATLLGLPAEELASSIHSDAAAPVVADALKRTGLMPAPINPVLLISCAALLLIGLLLAVYVAIGAESLDPLAATPTTGIVFDQPAAGRESE